MIDKMESARSPFATLVRYVLTVAVFVVALLAGLWVFAGQLAPSGYWWSIGFGGLWFVIAWLILRFGGGRFPRFQRIGTLTLAVTGVAVLAIFLWTSLRDVTVNEEIASGVAASQIVDESGQRAVDAVGNSTGGDAAPADGSAEADVQAAGDEQANADAASSSAGGATATAEPVPSGNIELVAGEFVTQAHSSSGRAAIVQLDDGSRVLTFEDLDTDAGPDLRVYLVDGPAEDDDLGLVVDLGGLKGNIGNQQYEIPDDVDVDRFTTVSIWCRAFSVGFAKADLAAS